MAASIEGQIHPAQERRIAPIAAERAQELRVGEIRVFYDVTGDTVEVLAIVAKSEAESWLAQFGKPE